MSHSLREHYSRFWGTAVTPLKWSQGPVHELPMDFCVLEFEPYANGPLWVYATSGMSAVTGRAPGSPCSFGLLSSPYLDGPSLENYWTADGIAARCLWLIPITRNEVALKKEEGLEALEKRLEQSALDYADPLRPDLAVNH